MGKGARTVWQALVLSFAVVIAVALLLPAAAEAAKSKPPENDGPPMRFVIVRSASPGCEPLCPEWISAEGAITQSTPASLKKFLKKLGDKRLPVIVTSPGGRVEAALELGRILRARKLDIGVGLTRFVECAPEQKGCKLDPARKGIYQGALYSAGAYCASACSMMFAGGVRRHVGQWAYMGVHQVTSYVTQQKITYRETYRVVKGKKKTVSRKVVGRKTVGSYTTTKMGKAFNAKMLAYLKEMGVKAAMYEVGQSTPAAEMRQLAPVEMLSMNLITSLDATDVLVSIENCKVESPAANCVLASGAKMPRSAYPKPLLASGEGMWLAVVRSSEAGCEPDCPEWISAEGPVDAKADERLAAMLGALGDRKLPLVISTAGGDLAATMEMGRIVRKNDLDVAIGSTIFVGCKPHETDCTAKGAAGVPYYGNAVSTNSECLGSCVLILSAGRLRLAGSGVLFGWDDLPADKAVSAYVHQMGLDPEVAKTRPSILLDGQGQVRLIQSKLLSQGGSVAVVVDGDICKYTWIPRNCRNTSESFGGRRPTVSAPAAPVVAAAPAVPPMSFVVTRSIGMACAPTCRDWISAEGRIDAGTPDRLKAMLKKVGDRLPLVISSKGGEVDAAIALGQLARKHNLVVVVGSTAISGCQAGKRDCVTDKFTRHTGIATSYGGVCINECALVLAGGVQRLAGTDTVIAWAKAGTMPQAATEKAQAHLKAMGVNSRVLGETSVGPLGDRTQWRLFRMNLLSATLTVETVLAGHICKGAPAPCFTADL
jgi:hypothetical protein